MKWQLLSMSHFVSNPREREKSDRRVRRWEESKTQEAHGPQFAHLSETATADMQMACNIFSNTVMQQFSNTVKYWNLWQDNGLNSFWDSLLTRLRCWNFQNAISKKSSDIFQKSFGSSTYPSFKGFFFFLFLALATILFSSAEPF